MAISIGSCRIITDNSKFIYDFTHSTTDIIQMLNLLHNEKLDTEFCDEFILINRYFNNLHSCKKILKNVYLSLKKSNTVVIEISSIKNVKYKDIYLQLDLYQSFINLNQKHKERFSHLNKEKIEKNTEITVMNEDEVFSAVTKIVTSKYLSNKKIILVPHVNVNINNNYSNLNKSIYSSENIYISNRELICKVLKNICDKYSNCIYFNPMNYLPNDPEFVFKKKKNKFNYGHYSKDAADIIKNELTKFIEIYKY